MQNNPITADLVQHIKSIEKRLSVVENRPTGTIVVDQQIITTDPSTGVKTVIGDLSSEGEVRHGIKEWIGDTEPPPVPSVPVVLANPGMFSITWNGLNLDGAPQAPDFSHLNIYAKTSTTYVKIGVIRTKDEVAVYSDPVAGTKWRFAATSVDKNGNESLKSADSAEVTAKAVPIDPTVTDGLNALIQEDVRLAGLYEAAALAASNADKKAQDALDKSKNLFPSGNLETISGGNFVNNPANAHSGNIVWYRSVSASVSDVLGTAFTVKPNTDYLLSYWVKADKDIQGDTTGLSLSINRSAGGAVVNTSGILKSTRGTLVPGMWTKVLYKITTPALATTIVPSFETTAIAGSPFPQIWMDDVVVFELTDSLEDALTAATRSGVLAQNAAQAAGVAQSTANGKNTIWYSGTKPTGSTHVVGDVWFNTSKDNQISRWDGSDYVVSLIGNDALFANIDAAKMTVGFLAAERIAALSLTAKHIVLANTDNLIPDPQFRYPELWSNTGETGVGSGFTTEKLYGNAINSFKMTPRDTGGVRTMYAPMPIPTNPSATNSRIPVIAGDWYTPKTMVLYTGTGVGDLATSIDQRMYFYDTAGTILSGAGNSSAGAIAMADLPAADTWFEVGGRPVQAPPGSAYMAPRITVYRPTTATVGRTWYISNVQVTRAGDGRLVVDGSITTDSLGANVVTADKMVIGFGDEMYPDPRWVSPAFVNLITKGSTGTASVNLTTGQLVYKPTSTSANYIRPAGVVDSTAAAPTWYPVSPGEQYNFELKMTTAGTGTVYMLMRSANGATTGHVNLGPVTSAIPMSFDLSVPANMAWMTPSITVLGSTSDITFDPGTVSIKRKTNGKLLVSGTVKGDALEFNTIEGKHVKAKTLAVGSLLVGATDNVISDPEFTNTNSEWFIPGTPPSTIYLSPTNEGVDGNSALKIIGASAQRGCYSAPIPVSSSQASVSIDTDNKTPDELETYRVSVWVKSSKTVTAGNNINIYARNFLQGTNTSSTRAINTRITENKVTGVKTKVAGNPAMVANEWTLMSGEFTVPAGSGKINFGFFIQTSYGAGTVWFSNAAAYRMSDGNLFVEGSITGDHLHANTIDALHIKADAIDASHIKAGEIDVTKLTVGGGANLLADPMFENGPLTAYRCSLDVATLGWYKTSNYIRTKTDPTPSTGTYLFRVRNSSSGSIYKDSQVVPGSRYQIRYEMFSSSTLTGTTRIALNVTKTDGTTAYVGDSSGANDTIATNWKTYLREYLVPADVVSLGVVIQITNLAGTGYLALRNVTMIPMTTGELIVDGALDAKTITGPLIQTNPATNRGITLNGLGTNNSLSAWDASGNRTFLVDGNNGNVTLSGVVKTEFSGPRIEMSTTPSKDPLMSGANSTITFHTKGPIAQIASTRFSDGAHRTVFGHYNTATDGKIRASLVMDSSSTGDQFATTELNAFSMDGLYSAGIAMWVTGTGSSRASVMTMFADDIELGRNITSYGTLRMFNTTDASLTSTGHAIQIGASNGLNVIMDDNELMSRDNGAYSTWNAVGSNVTISGNNVINGGWIASLDWYGREGRAGYKASTSTQSYFQFEHLWTTTNAANAYLNASGTLYRSTSSAKNKIDVVDTPVEWDDKILGLKARTWFDKRQAEELADFVEEQSKGGSPENENLTYLRRVPGMVAEEVESAGLAEFVQYGADGQVEGLMYDRLGVALIPIVGRLRDRVVELERKIDLVLSNVTVV